MNLDKLNEKVKKAKSKEEKLELKSVYRFAIGDLQNINPFWRATIVKRCNQLVEKYKDNWTIYCNTDSIVSAVRRPDIENDPQFKWKLKREGETFKWQKGTKKGLSVDEISIGTNTNDDGFFKSWCKGTVCFCY